MAIGSYFVSLGIRPEMMSSNLHAVLNPKFFFAGVAFNLTGSLFWAYGRTKWSSYALAWNSYLLLLVVFGILISCFLGKDKLILNQYVGIGLATLAIFMLSKQ